MVISRISIWLNLYEVDMQAAALHGGTRQSQRHISFKLEMLAKLRVGCQDSQARKGCIDFALIASLDVSCACH